MKKLKWIKFTTIRNVDYLQQKGAVHIAIATRWAVLRSTVVKLSGLPIIYNKT